MSEKSDRHAELMALWQAKGRDPVVQVPQYERADGMAVSQYFRPRVDRYAFQGRE